MAAVAFLQNAENLDWGIAFYRAMHPDGMLSHSTLSPYIGGHGMTTQPNIIFKANFISNNKILHVMG